MAPTSALSSSELLEFFQEHDFSTISARFRPSQQKSAQVHFRPAV
jgi:hypothetical protein